MRQSASAVLAAPPPARSASSPSSHACGTSEVGIGGLGGAVESRALPRASARMEDEADDEAEEAGWMEACEISMGAAAAFSRVEGGAEGTRSSTARSISPPERASAAPARSRVNPIPTSWWRASLLPSSTCIGVADEVADPPTEAAVVTAAAARASAAAAAAAPGDGRLAVAVADTVAAEGL